MIENLPSTLDKISARQISRIAFIQEISNEAGLHLHFHSGECDGRTALNDDAAAWQDENHRSGWRSKVRKMWLDYPRFK